MKRHIKPSLCFVIMLISIISNAQSIPLGIDRQFNLSILDVLDDYERYVSFAENSDRKRFLYLFEDQENSSVFNDMIGTASFMKQVTPKEYVELMPDNGTFFIKTFIYNVEKGSSYIKDGKYHKHIIFSKYVMLIDGSTYSGDAGGIFFDSSTLFDDDPDFILDADIVYDQENKIAKISSILPLKTKKPSAINEDKFDIILKPKDNHKYQDVLRSNGDPIVYDTYGQSFVSHNSVEAQSQNLIVDVNTIANGDRYDVLSFNITPLTLRSKLKFSILPQSAYAVNSSFDNMLASSKGVSLGIDIGFESSPVSSVHFGLYTGVAAELSKIDLSSGIVSYTLNFGSIIGQRSYRFNANESISMGDLSVPLYMELEIDATKSLIFSIDLGGKAYINYLTKLSPYHISGEFSGKTINTDFEAFISPVNYSRNTFDIAAFGDLEIDYMLMKKKLFAYVLAGYEYGLTESYTNGNMLYYDNNRNVYPFVYSNTLREDVPFRSLIGSTEFQRRALLLSFGLKFKF